MGHVDHTHAHDNNSKIDATYYIPYMHRHYDRIDFHYDRTYRGRIAYSALWSLSG